MSTIIFPARPVPSANVVEIITPLGFEADCEVTDNVGDPVSIDASNKVIALGTNVYDDLVVGLIYQKLTPTTCVVVIGGVFKSVTTGLTPTKPIWVSTTGGLTTTKPSTGHLQILGQALSSTDMVVNINLSKVVQS
jgi:hypothetical protein